MPSNPGFNDAPPSDKMTIRFCVPGYIALFVRALHPNLVERYNTPDVLAYLRF